MAETEVGAAPLAPVSPWVARLNAVLLDPRQITIAAQPIVGLEYADIVGYEALARFSDGTPTDWLTAAELLGLRGELEAAILARALPLRADLPNNCFLTVNLSPHLATSEPVQRVLAQHPDLSRVMIELTENAVMDDLSDLLRLREELVRRGGLLALDDAGSGYSGLRQIAALRPHLIKLDRDLVRNAEQDEVKLALVEMLGELAGRLDAWLLVEGVETWSELAAFARLRVPLAQGYLFGHASAPWSRLDPQTVCTLRQLLPRIRSVETVTSLIDSVPVVDRDDVPPQSIAIRVDPHDRPVEVWLPSTYRHPGEPGRHVRVGVSFRVRPSDGLTQVAQRLLARPAHERFDPIVVVDDSGAAVGVLRVERILARLAEPGT